MKYIYSTMFLLLLFCASAKTGQMKLLAVSNVEDNPQGSIADLQLETRPGTGRVFIDSFPLSKIDTQISTRFAKEVACNYIEADCSDYDFFYTIRANSALIGGPSAGAAITILTISMLDDLPLDESVSITGTINTGGIIGPVGSILPKAESAAKDGIKKVLVPKYTDLNETNITDFEKEYDIEIVEVSHLDEALKEFTGKDFSNHDNVNITDSYLDTMSTISLDLCERAHNMSEGVFDKENVTALNLLKKGDIALEEGNYYSAASFCFGSALNTRNRLLQNEGLDELTIRKKIDAVEEQASYMFNQTKKVPLKTLTDLETYMAVTDRILEAQERLSEAREDMNNSLNSSIFQLAYAIERLNSAKSWSVFFGKPGREFRLSDDVIRESCLKKISEVEERIQYISLYVPANVNDIRDEIDKAYEDHNNGNPELCLYKASIAKARIDLVLNSLSIDPDYSKEVIEDRLTIVKNLIAKQNERGMFPIIAYSYYEYADSLKETDEYSALLYLEYALELGNMDIYFEKKKIELPKFPTQYVWVFLVGMVVGILLTLVLVKINRTPHRKKR